MRKSTSTPGGNSSFMPGDYLARKAEMRANVINLFLFGVVLFGVIAAFLVTNRQWDAVKSVQQDINKEFTAEATKIEQLKKLEEQKAEMVEKLEISTALIERVPRSILMAELVNRMPEKLTLTDFELKSARAKDMRPAVGAAKAQPNSLSAKPATPSGSKTARAGGKDAKDVKPPRQRPPKIDFSVTLTGYSATDTDVADYHAKLKQCPLLDRVELISSKESKIDDVAVREFRIEAVIRDSADARSIEPLQVPRLRSASRVVNANPAVAPGSK